MTVRELEYRMTAREMDEWRAYARIEPFGEERDDLRMGTIAATVANSAPFRKKGSKAFKPSDFFPDFEGAAKRAEPKKPMTPDETADYLAALMGG
jgi:hypothetical protein